MHNERLQHTTHSLYVCITSGYNTLHVPHHKLDPQSQDHKHVVLAARPAQIEYKKL